MANTVRTIDLDADPTTFETTYADLLGSVKRNYDAAGNLAGAMDETLATRFIIAEYTNLIDDFILEAQRLKLRFLRFASGAPAYAAPIGTHHTNTTTGDVYVNRTGATDGWVLLQHVYRASNPEGVVTAPVGSLCIDDQGTGGLYFKATGTGNTGWREVVLA